MYKQNVFYPLSFNHVSDEYLNFMFLLKGDAFCLRCPEGYTEACKTGAYLAECEVRHKTSAERKMRDIFLFPSSCALRYMSPALSWLNKHLSCRLWAQCPADGL